MIKKGASKSQIFLLEFVFVVLFFAICATVCVSAFVKADNLSTENGIKNEAIIQAESAAEIIKASAVSDGNVALSEAAAELENCLEAVLAEPVNGKIENEAGLMVYYDDGFRPCAEDSASHAMYISMEYKDGFVTAGIRVDGDLFSLDVKKYVGGASNE